MKADAAEADNSGDLPASPGGGSGQRGQSCQVGQNWLAGQGARYSASGVDRWRSEPDVLVRATS